MIPGDNHLHCSLCSFTSISGEEDSELNSFRYLPSSQQEVRPQDMSWSVNATHVFALFTSPLLRPHTILRSDVMAGVVVESQNGCSVSPSPVLLAALASVTN